jgi:isopentenyl-diphosphate delta-isomerase
MDREQLLVELVDNDGAAVGAATVADAHTSPGQRHRAFSVMLCDRSGRLLMQRRAPTKSRFALRWSNTCCGHPAPNEDVAEAAARRLREEMGLDVRVLSEVGVHDYRASDPATGRVEYEHDHVLVGLHDGTPPRPDSAEVAEWRWASPGDLDGELGARPEDFTPWLPGVLTIVRRAIDG